MPRLLNLPQFVVWMVVVLAIILTLLLGFAVWFPQSDFLDTPVPQTLDRTFADGDLEALITTAESAVARYPDDADAYIALALAYAHVGSSVFQEEEYGASAVEAARRALDLGSTHPEAYRALGFAYEIMERYTEALAAYDDGLSQHPLYAPLLAQRGHALDLMGRIEEAGAYYRQAVSLDPSLEYARLNLVRYLVRLDDAASLDEARVQVLQLIDDATTDHARAQALSALGSIEYAREDYTASMTAFEQSLILDPTSLASGMGLAWARFKTLATLGDDQAAFATRVQSIFQLIRTALSLHPEETSAYHLAGILNALLGNTDEARTLLIYARDTIVQNDISLSAREKESQKEVLNQALASLTTL